MSKVCNIEWLANSLSLKGMKLELVSGGAKSGIEWTDKCGVFAKLESEQLKAMACLLVFGDWQETNTYLNTVSTYLVHNAMNACTKRKLNLRDSSHTLTDLLQRMSKLCIYLHLRPELQKVFPTIFGRLYFGGILMEEGTYRKTWREFEVVMLDTLANWQAQVDESISEYREELNQAVV